VFHCVHFECPATSLTSTAPSHNASAGNDNNDQNNTISDWVVEDGLKSQQIILRNIRKKYSKIIIENKRRSVDTGITNFGGILFKNLMFCQMCWRLPQTDTNTVFNPVPPRQSDVRVESLTKTLLAPHCHLVNSRYELFKQNQKQIMVVTLFQGHCQTNYSQACSDLYKEK
jgi:5-keto 4-deoxyuronate isomerase